MCGGNSNEREVSFSSAANVEKALTAAGHRVTKIDTANRGFLEELQQLKPDVAFIALHGKGGEDGSLQAVLEHLGIPYTGSGVLGSALAMDKYRAKIIYGALGLKTPQALCLKRSSRGTPPENLEHILQNIGLPVVIKPSEEGSSFGVTIAKDAKTLQEAVEESFDAGTAVLLAERYVKGVEITVSVVGSTELQVLSAIEIVPMNEFYDFESKYAEGGSDHLIPARISEGALAEANRAALLAHEGLGCFGVSRTDMIVDENDEVWVIETNTIPGMTGTSLLPHAAEYNGISSTELYENFILWALQRAAEASLKTT